MQAPVSVAVSAAAAEVARHAARATGMAKLDIPIGELVAETAQQIWSEGITEPSRNGIGGTPERIDEFIRGDMGLGWSNADRRQSARPLPYTANGSFAWCGAFAAYCWGLHGLKAGIRKRIMPSCYRLQDRWRPRRVASVQPGDILVVGDGDPRWGDHICVAIKVEGGLIHTVEGNARGLLPNDSVGEGVIKRTRLLPGASADEPCPISGLPQWAKSLFIYRPLPIDLE